MATGKTLQTLQAAVKRAGAAWEAGETSISAESPPQQQARLGLDVDDAELKAVEKAINAANAVKSLSSTLGAPAAIDWRNNGGNFITPIRDQQSCGSCVSFACVATVESRLNIACRTPGQNRDLAEADLFYCGCGNCCANGWNFPPALDHFRNTGVAPESAFPYVPANQPCPGALANRTRITAWAAKLAMADRKNSIANKGPVVAGMAVYADFYNYRNGVYRHVSGALQGYHAVSVVGYDDARGCWIAKNSWGTGWGENGFFNIAYGDSGMDTQFAFYEVDVVCAAPVDPCASYVAYLKRVLVASRTNRALRACLLYHVCGGVHIPPICNASVMAVVKRVRAILARCPHLRAPFCRSLLG